MFPPANYSMRDYIGYTVHKPHSYHSYNLLIFARLQVFEIRNTAPTQKQYLVFCTVFFLGFHQVLNVFTVKKVHFNYLNNLLR